MIRPTPETVSLLSRQELEALELRLDEQLALFDREEVRVR